MTKQLSAAAVPQAAGFGVADIAVLIIAIIVVIAIVMAVVGHILARRGVRQPLVVRAINRSSSSLVDTISRPVTIAVLDEVADVLRTGHYTRNISAAMQENHNEIKAMVAEKIKADPTIGRVGMVPFHDRILEEASETTLRVIYALLADARTDELISDMLRDNIEQIRSAIHEKD